MEQIEKNIADLAAAHLENLGFTGVDIVSDTTIAFDGEYVGSEIDIDDIEYTDTAADIERKATYFSCCGDELDRDFMICRTCGEHCG